MATVTLKDVRKTYGAGTKAFTAVHGVSVDIADGEFMVLVGPSGCGKSTLLRMVAGLEAISGGTVSIGGKVVNDVEPKDRDIAMVFQNYALYPHMSVYDNMAYGLRIRGIADADIKARVERAAGILELQPMLTRKPQQLSGGQRQRVAMGRAIVRNPSVFLFDEPLSNLDAKLRVQMRIELQKLHRDLKTTSLYVTHDQVEAMTLGQRMMVLNKGVAEQVGAPLEVYAKPATTFVAAFIGSPAMNLLQGKVEGQSFSLASGTRIEALAPVASAVTLGLRPEHITPCSATEAQLTLGVDMVESLGADSYAYCTLGGNTVTVRLPGGMRASVSDALPVRIAPSHAHWFGADGRRVEAQA
jgi:sn-glycerol 3-phosphate transport system ATP-binding protein